MSIDFNAWNEAFGGEEAIKAVKEAAQNEYKETPEGTYTCALERLELGESKNAKPMIKGMFRISEGEYKKQCLFINQVVTPGFPMHKGLEFLRSLNVFDDSEIDFTGDFAVFNDLLLDILEESAGMKFEVRSYSEKGYLRLDVVDTFDK